MKPFLSSPTLRRGSPGPNPRPARPGSRGPERAARCRPPASRASGKKPHDRGPGRRCRNDRPPAQPRRLSETLVRSQPAPGISHVAEPACRTLPALRGILASSHCPLRADWAAPKAEPEPSLHATPTLPVHRRTHELVAPSSDAILARDHAPPGHRSRIRRTAPSPPPSSSWPAGFGQDHRAVQMADSGRAGRGAAGRACGGWMAPPPTPPKSSSVYCEMFGVTGRARSGDDRRGPRRGRSACWWICRAWMRSDSQAIKALSSPVSRLPAPRSSGAQRRLRHRRFCLPDARAFAPCSPRT